MKFNIMGDLIQYFKENSSWIKDFFTLIFTGTATIIAILTYRRAKATVLQPKRTEVTKIQTQILTDFLKTISANGNTIDSSLDYLGIFNCNFYFTLIKSGIGINQDPEINEHMNSKVAGCYARIHNNQNVTQLQGTFEDVLFLLKTENVTNIVVLTKQALDTINRIIELKVNPFIPLDINEIADEIMNDLTYNYFELMPNYCRLLMPINKDNIRNMQKDYERFEKERRHHTKTTEKLRQKIREHLGINDKW